MSSTREFPSLNRASKKLTVVIAGLRERLDQEPRDHDVGETTALRSVADEHERTELEHAIRSFVDELHNAGGEPALDELRRRALLVHRLTEPGTTFDSLTQETTSVLSRKLKPPAVRKAVLRPLLQDAPGHYPVEHIRELRNVLESILDEETTREADRAAVEQLVAETDEDDQELRKAIGEIKRRRSRRKSHDATWKELGNQIKKLEVEREHLRSETQREVELGSQLKKPRLDDAGAKLVTNLRNECDQILYEASKQQTEGCRVLLHLHDAADAPADRPANELSKYELESSLIRLDLRMGTMPVHLLSAVSEAASSLTDWFEQRLLGDDDLRTDPMTITEIGKWFVIHRNQVRKEVLDRYEHDDVAGKFRMRVADMPASYHKEKGLLK